MINLFLVDDHELVRTGIRRLLEDIRGINVIGEAQSGEEAVKWCRLNQADVVLMDINMPGIGGIEAARKILRFSSNMRILILTMFTKVPLTGRVMQNGVSGYISKDISLHEMVAAIRTVHVGQRYITPAIAQQMVLSQFDQGNGEPFSLLSSREWQIMLMITQGKKVREIAIQLNLSPKTVNCYRYRMFQKLKIDSDVELTRLALRSKLLDVTDL